MHPKYSRIEYIFRFTKASVHTENAVLGLFLEKKHLRFFSFLTTQVSWAACGNTLHGNRRISLIKHPNYLISAIISLNINYEKQNLVNYSIFKTQQLDYITLHFRNVSTLGRSQTSYWAQLIHGTQACLEGDKRTRTCCCTKVSSKCHIVMVTVEANHTWTKQH